MTCPACGAPAPEGARFCRRVRPASDRHRRRAPGRDGADGRPRRLHRAVRRHRPRAGQAAGRQRASTLSSPTSSTSAATSTRSSATRSWPCSARRSPTRTTPSGRCEPRLRMHETLAALAPDLGIRVQMRVGVNTGEVLVGAMRAGGDPTVMGDVVNTTQRLEKLADPGQVVVGPATYAATRASIRYESLGPAGSARPRGTGRGVPRDRRARAAGTAPDPRAGAAARPRRGARDARTRRRDGGPARARPPAVALGRSRRRQEPARERARDDRGAAISAPRC